MKLRFIATLLACFAIYFFLPSCKSRAKFIANPGGVLKGPINITGYDISNGSLTLEDNNHNNASWVVVSRITTVNWNLVTGSAASKIIIQEHRSGPKFSIQ